VAKAKRIVTDASHRDDEKMAAIAACWARDGEPCWGDIVSAPNANCAEALAVLRMLHVAKEAHFKSLIVETDCLILPLALVGATRGDQMFMAIAKDIITMIEWGKANKKNWSVKHTHRSNVRPAHIMSRQMMKGWRAGQQKSSTWSRGGAHA
jgi:hypothetical protein